MVARRRALALRARDPARGDDRPRRAGALARRAAAGVPRSDGLPDGVHRPGRRRVRLGVLRPDRGAEHVLRRAAPLHRAPRVGRAWRAAPACCSRRRRRRLRAPRGRDPVRPLPHHLGDHGHADAAALLVAPGPDRAGWIGGSRRFGLAAALAAAFLFVPRRYALVLPLLVLGLWVLAIRPIWWGTHGFERFSRGALFQGIRTADRDWVDRALPPGARRGVPLDRAHRSAHREPERVLQSRRRPGLLRHRPDARRVAGDARTDRSARPAR